jgi:Fe-S-cluster containining protein
MPDDLDAVRSKHFGEPCPFLRGYECSIYASRPLECRLHANIGVSPAFCDTTVPLNDKSVPNLDYTAVWQVVGTLFYGAGFGDIRDFWQ